MFKKDQEQAAQFVKAATESYSTKELQRIRYENFLHFSKNEATGISNAKYIFHVEYLKSIITISIALLGIIVAIPTLFSAEYFKLNIYYYFAFSLLGSCVMFLLENYRCMYMSRMHLRSFYKNVQRYITMTFIQFYFSIFFLVLITASFFIGIFGLIEHADLIQQRFK